MFCKVVRYDSMIVLSVLLFFKRTTPTYSLRGFTEFTELDLTSNILSYCDITTTYVIHIFYNFG